MKAIEILKEKPADTKIKAALFDFDGTISTLRQGWEEIMEPLMVEMICGDTEPDDELVREVREYIDESTGIQTIFQMRWLVEAVKRHGRNPVVHDEWWYKDEYNRRLLEMVRKRAQKLIDRELDRFDFMISGAEDFLKALHERGIKLYVASGTDHVDVVREVEALGLTHYFAEIAGAPMRRADCSKEAVLRSLLSDKGLRGSELLVVGDGKVEIALGVEVGGTSLGTATDEVKRSGLNPVKRNRLVKAGAHAIIGDFACCEEILEWLGL